MEDILECLDKKELSTTTEEPAYSYFGPVSGCEKTYCLAVISKVDPALSITPQLTEQLLRPFETVRPGTEVFFHNMKGSWPHWLDQDVRRLRLHFLPNYTFGNVATFN